MSIITPRTLKGFRDLEPAQLRQRNRIVASAQKTLETFGFNPIATPILEYAEILLGKAAGETEKQVYRFQDGGQRDVAMRYDLTVPLARFCAQRSGQLVLPFRAYQIGLVWRGEKAQRGRYREFMQCDFDILGATSTLSDAEILTVAATLVDSFFDDGFCIRASDRTLLKEFIRECGVDGDVGGVLRALDKLPKIGRDKTLTELTDRAGIPFAQAERLLAFAGLRGDSKSVKSELAQLTQNPSVLAQLDRLEETLNLAQDAGIPAERIEVDLSITRGLDYYTGLVFETFALGQQSVGSICSGGRYDNLTGLYSRQVVQGVGGSVGVDRLLSLVAAREGATAEVLVANIDNQSAAVKLAASLRKSGVAAELFLQPSKLKAQLKYADRRGHRLVVIVAEAELARDSCQLKNMQDGTSKEVSLSNCADECRALLAAN